MGHFLGYVCNKGNKVYFKNTLCNTNDQYFSYLVLLASVYYKLTKNILLVVLTKYKDCTL